MYANAKLYRNICDIQCSHFEMLTIFHLLNRFKVSLLLNLGKFALPLQSLLGRCSGTRELLLSLCFYHSVEDTLVGFGGFFRQTDSGFVLFVLSTLTVCK